MPRRGRFRRSVGRYGLFAGVAAALALAWLFPGPALDGSWLGSGFASRIAVFLIFLLQGLALPAETLAGGVLKWREHVFVQGLLFGLFPLLALGVDFLFGAQWGWLEGDARLGLLFLAILPTTISTCVVFTAQAGGNVATALFNTVVANILAVFIVPLWIAWIAGYGTGGFSVRPLIADIALLVLLPLAAGQGVRPWLRARAEKHAGRLRAAANAAILFIIYAAFARSIAAGSWERNDGVMAACGLTAVLFVLIHFLAWRGSGLFRFSEKDRTAVFFCASQKSLAMGVPLAQLLFAGRPEIGLILLPILLYHALQSLVGGLLAGRMGEVTSEK